MEKRLLKVHALGNMFYLYNINDENEIDLIQMTKSLSLEKKYGEVDGLIAVSTSKIADAKMQIINADGSTKDFCLNAIRCAGRFVCEQLNKSEVSVETSIGTFHVKKAESFDGNVITYAVKLYPISFNLNSLPMDFQNKTYIDNEVIKEFSPTIRFTAVSLIQPHLVGIVDEHFIQICKHQYLLGQHLNGEKNVICKDGINVSYVYKIKNDTIFARTYERKLDFSNSCSLAMAASALVAKKANLIDSKMVTVYNEKGFVKCEVDIEDKNYNVTLIGDATVVAECIIDLEDNEYKVLNYNETEELPLYEKSIEHVLSTTVSFHC